MSRKLSVKQKTVGDKAEAALSENTRPVSRAVPDPPGELSSDAERKLRQSEIRYRRLFQSAKDGIIILDANTRKIIDANEFMSDLVGVEPEGLLGKELFEIGMFKDIKANKEAFRELQRTGYLRHDHLPVQSQSDEIIEVEFIANTYMEGELLVAQCNVRDISERAALERQIARQAELLAKESRRKDEFLAMLSHELRNPLAAILSALNLLKLEGNEGDDLKPSQAREIIARQIGNLTSLINDLLEVSRVLSGRIRLNKQPLNICQVLKFAVDSVTPLIKQRQHKLTLDLCPDGIMVVADAARIEQIFINLLNNAAKYSPYGSNITLRCNQPAGENFVEVVVSDTGVGIDPSLLTHIFELFMQADHSLDRAAGGLGVGLSLAHQLVSMHGGTIRATSEGLGKGSQFTVRLPAENESKKLPPTPVEKAPLVQGSLEKEGRRVLVVDDNVDMVTMLAGVLRYKGYSVKTAYTGPEGVETAHDWRPEIVLLDIGLPGLDGYEVARRLRKDKVTKSARVIALSGYGRDSDIAQAHEAGFDAHMVKPCDFDELEKVMTKVPEEPSVVLAK